MTDGYFNIRVSSAAMRWVVCVAVVVAALVAIAISARWAIAETVLFVAARTPVPVGALERAYAFEPSNPDTAFALGTYYMDTAQQPDLDAAGRLLDAAAADAPNRSAVWLAVGRQREIAGRTDEAEHAFERAGALAPYHWSPPWALGNLYVRQGRLDAAAAPLRRAVELDAEMAPLAVRTVWMASDRDLGATVRSFNGNAASESALVGLLVSEKRLDDAVKLWRWLAAVHTGNAQVADQGRQLAVALLAAGRGADYIDILSAVDPEHVPALGRLANAGFEEPIAERAATPFEWTVMQAPEAHVSLDAGREGGKALRVDYTSKGGAAFTHATEFVRVTPGAPYTVTFWAATRELQTGGAPYVAVYDAANDAQAIATAPLASGTTEWTQYRVTFKGPASGIAAIRVGRAPCGDMCPIFGTIRIDDLALEK
jgi:tetratricopeptide (TPR) repeat protein